MHGMYKICTSHVLASDEGVVPAGAPRCVPFLCAERAMIFNLYIYDRRGKCLFYKEWSRPLNTLADDPEEEKKLMFGMVYSLKELTSKISPTRGPEGLHTVKTKVQLDASPVFSPP
jgi:hypothetical protein